MTKREILKIVLIVVAILVGLAALMWLLYLIAPYLVAIIIFPTWLAAALAEGGRV